MPDKELTEKLTRRLAALNAARPDSNSHVTSDPETNLSPPPPPPPPPPSVFGRDTTPPFAITSENEITDMDKLIADMLRFCENPLQNKPVSCAAKDEACISESCKKAEGISLANSVTNDSVQSESVYPRCTAPVVPIVHHKLSEPRGDHHVNYQMHKVSVKYKVNTSLTMQ